MERSISAAVAAAMAKSENKVVEIEPIVDAIAVEYPNVPKTEIAERVIMAVSAIGGAVWWPGKP